MSNAPSDRLRLRALRFGALLLASWASSWASDAPLAGPQEGQVAPLFQTKTLQYDDFTLATRMAEIKADRGLLVIDFWATWCAPCKRELPVFEKIHKELAAKGVRFLAVSVDERRPDVWKFVKENGYTFPVAHDANAFQVGKKYGAGSGAPLPQIFILDEDRVVRFRHAGEIKNLERALKGRIEAIRPGTFPDAKGADVVTGEASSK